MQIKTEQIKTEQIEIIKHARYVTYGNLSKRTKYFWFVVHGSMMLCEQMIYKFNDFDPEEHFIVAPEATSRYYKEGFGGEVLASWMTSRDRLFEISDISNYLSKLYLQFTDQLDDQCVKSIVGFSQGGTMVFRWLHQKLVDVDHFIPYSCWIPEDIDLKKAKTDLGDVHIIYTYGDRDQYITEELFKEVSHIAKRNQIIFAVEKYAGDHRVDKAQLNLLFNKYIGLSVV